MPHNSDIKIKHKIMKFCAKSYKLQEQLCSGFLIQDLLTGEILSNVRR